MNYRGVAFLLGRLQLVLSLTLLVPAGVDYYFDGAQLWTFVLPAILAFVVGLILILVFRQKDEFSFGRREAFLLVSSAWVTATLVGALPFVMFRGPAFVVDAVFESASGFTTTGASVFANVEVLPPSILIWRALTQWLGGMGIIVLAIAILPKLAIGGMELLGAEAPGPIQEKLTPRIAQTAKMLWGIYVLLTSVEVLILLALGLTPIDAVAHAFASMATGGFSTKNASVAGFESGAVEWVITLFMVLAGANFSLHYHWIRGRFANILGDAEFRLYLRAIGFVSLVVLVNLLWARTAGFFDAIRLSLFQTVSIVTTTGFATTDYDNWPHLSRTVLWMAMFVGGCAGSTGGSVKVVRLIIVVKKIIVDLKQTIQPHAVLPVRLGKKAIPPDVVSSVTSFFVLFVLLFAIGGVALTAMGVGPETAFSASAACLGNIGPGFDQVGPSMNYAALPALGKLVLVFLMLVGRLELYTMLVIVFLRGGS